MHDGTTGDLILNTDSLDAAAGALDQLASGSADPVTIAPAVLVLLGWYLLRKRKRAPK